MKRALATATAVGLLAATAPAAAQTSPREHWGERVPGARAYAKSRPGRIAFAVFHDGRLRGGYHLDEQHRSASLSKAMLLVAYLNHPRVRARRLTRADRRLLAPMITRSDNDAADRVHAYVGSAGMARIGRRARMRRLTLSPWWGATLVTPRDQARFFSRIDLLVPRRHRGYARALLAGVVPSQRWGMPRALPSGWRIFFKGGWRPEAGARLVNEAALIQRGRDRIAIAVLCDGAPSHWSGAYTVQGIARRLLRGADGLRS